MANLLSSLTAPTGRRLQLYSSAFVFVNGTLLLQESSVSIQKKSNSLPVHTLHKGFAGLSAGSGVVEINIDNAVPSVDFEFVGGALVDFWIKSGEPVEIGVVMGSRQTILKGFIDEASYSHSTNDASKLSFHILGRLEAFE